MRPSILIIEPRRDIADALQDVVISANYAAIVRPHVEHLSDLAVMPAAIILRVAFEGLTEPAHTVLTRLPVTRPPVIAIASEDAEVAEAERLGCDVVLRAPDDVGRLYDTLSRLVHA